MTIASEITRINNNIADSYTACSNQGATLPATQNSANLPATISTIPASRFGATLDTFLNSIDGSGNLYRANRTTNLSFDGVVKLQADALRYAFLQNPNIATVTFPDCTTVAGSYALSNTFNTCSNLTSVTFPVLTSVGANYGMYVAFNACTSLTTLSFPSLSSAGYASSFRNLAVGCTALTSISFPSLITVTGSLAFYDAFEGCTSLTSVTFPELTQIGNGTTSGTNLQHFALAFKGCTSLTELRFPKLEKIYCTGGTAGNNGTFANNETIEKMYFPKLNTITYSPGYTGSSTSYTSACKMVFYNCAALTEIHFAAANETAIKATAGWSTLWGRGAGNATVYFDL